MSAARSLDELLGYVWTHPADVMWLRPPEFITLSLEGSESIYGRSDFVPGERIRCGHKTVRMARWPR